jgi:hypothetical protein
MYFGGVPAYRKKVDEVAAKGYEGFVFESDSPAAPPEGRARRHLRGFAFVLAKANRGDAAPRSRAMKKTALVVTLALVVVSGWPVGARAQEAAKIQTSHAPAPPGQTGGPVENHPELWTPEQAKEQAEAIGEYCSKHHDLCIAPAPPDTGSIDRAGRAWASTHPSGPADPSHTIECRTDPAHPNGPDLCYRASDHSRVYPGTPGKN